MKEKYASTRQFAVVMVGMALLAIVLLVAPQMSPNAAAAGVLVEHGTITQETTATSVRLNYQGRLVDPNTGNAKADGTYQIIFRLYDIDTGGTPLWSEAKDITVKNGLFSTLLGDMTAIAPSDFNGQELWLAVKVGADNEATPRQRIAHVGYAIFAENADTVDGMDASAFEID